MDPEHGNSPNNPLNQTESSSLQYPDPDTPPNSPPVLISTKLPTASVTLRHHLLWPLLIATIAITVALTILLHHGQALSHFDARDKTADQQTQLLDNYNSYSGNIVSLLVTLIGFVVALVMQLTALHACTRVFLQPHITSKTSWAVAVVSGVVVYLISNSFNALNVQLRDSRLEPVISSEDLSATSNTTSLLSSNVSNSVAESTAQNSIANTVLRTLVLPRATKSPLSCNWSLTTQNFRTYVPKDFVEVGFPQREWMARLLPYALDVTSLHFTMNATKTTTEVRSDELPMSASLAADLVVNTMFLSSEFIPWGKYDAWNDRVSTGIIEAYPPREATNMSEAQHQVPTAVLLNLLPMDSTASESAKKKWLLEAIEPVLASKFHDSKKFSLKDVGVKFEHVRVGSNITFDALTFELDVNTTLITNATNEADGTRYTQLNTAFNCGPWSERCLIPKAVIPPDTVVNYDLLYDAPSQVNAFAVCMNSDGSETIKSTINFNESDMIDYNLPPCSNISTSSMLLISVAKRLVADELISSVKGDSDGLHADEYSAVVTNLRKIYSFTVGRLNWKTVDLAKQYKASCNVDKGGCFGLSVELNTSAPVSNQHLIAGVEALPLNLLTTPIYNGFLHDEGQRPLSLIQVDEPARQNDAGIWYSVVAGDILLPHNVLLDRWDLGQVDWSQQMCAHQEDRVQLVLNNHYYMEHSLQVTYTSALFFLMQNGVPTDIVPLDQETTTLAFSANIQKIAIWISIPELNAVLTYIGCFVIIVVPIMVMLIMQKDRSLLDNTTPHVIARMMLDSKTFPTLLLHRQVEFSSENGRRVYPAENLIITRVSVQPLEQEDTLEAPGVRDINLA